jgi:hypothetical protein
VDPKAHVAGIGLLIDEHFEPLEADFQRFYGLDLRMELWGPKPIGARRLASLIRGLPPDSALHRALDPDGWAWGNVEELMAVLVEMFHSANTPKGTKPLKIRRPGASPERSGPRRQSTPAEIARVLGSNVVYIRPKGVSPDAEHR